VRKNIHSILIEIINLQSTTYEDVKIISHMHILPQGVVMGRLMDAKAKYSRHVLLKRAGYDELGMGEQKEVAESGAEVGAVEVRMFRGTWMIGLLALRTENLHGALASHVRKTHRKDWLAVAQRTRAAAKIHVLELLVLHVFNIIYNNVSR
jgi:hypothetical protein